VVAVIVGVCVIVGDGLGVTLAVGVGVVVTVGSRVLVAAGGLATVGTAADGEASGAEHPLNKKRRIKRSAAFFWKIANCGPHWIGCSDGLLEQPIHNILLD
jgi:hypothetical protein